MQPFVDRIGVTRLQQAVARNRVRRLASGNFQQGGTPFADIGPMIMIAIVL